MSENGLFNKTKKATDEYEQEQKDEEEKIDRVQATLSEYNGTAEGKKDSSKNRTLSGKTDGYTYKNPIIPQGFTAVDDGAGWFYKDDTQTEVKGWNDGLVIEDEEGNQFVWVPVEDSDNYKKTLFVEDNGKIVDDYDDGELSKGVSTGDNGKTVDDYEDGELPKDIIKEDDQITKYEGFYVGRYETGCEGNITYNDERPSDNPKPLIKLGKRPYSCISWSNAKEKAESYKNSSCVKSGLVTGKQWDFIMSLAENKGYNVRSDSSSWGTYFTSSNVVIPKGTKVAKGDNTKTPWEVLDDDYEKPKDSPLFHTSGSNERAKFMNIYDLAGNFFEWTNEKNVTRGGFGGSNGEIIRAGERRSFPEDYGGSHSIVFRIVLYIL